MAKGGGLPQHSHDVSNPLQSKFFFFPFHLFFFKKLSHDSYSPLPFSGEGQRACVRVHQNDVRHETECINDRLPCTYKTCSLLHFSSDVKHETLSLVSFTSSLNFCCCLRGPFKRVASKKKMILFFFFLFFFYRKLWNSVTNKTYALHNRMI